MQLYLKRAQIGANIGFTSANILEDWIKVVLRREIQGLKVWPVYRSQVFSITGTYF